MEQKRNNELKQRQRLFSDSFLWLYNLHWAAHHLEWFYNYAIMSAFCDTLSHSSVLSLHHEPFSIFLCPGRSLQPSFPPSLSTVERPYLTSHTEHQFSFMLACNPSLVYMMLQTEGKSQNKQALVQAEHCVLFDIRQGGFQSQTVIFSCL